MEWLKAIVPILGAALGGPLGGAAAAMIAAKLGLDSNTVEAVTEVLSSNRMTPEQIGALKLAELDFKKFLETNKIDVMKIEAGDRADARGMQVATHSKMPAVLTTMVTIGFFSVLAALLVFPEIKANEIVLVMVGQLSAVWGACVAFYVSTTYSGANKNALLASSIQPK